ncbi:MAG: ATP-binding protein [Candidatus Hydrogenedens sp.]|nr:ATP-binding protein [Candidatus Hydrogenedens sp.]
MPVKTAVINRAVPGSGKTTISNCIESYLSKKGLSVTLHSTDRYFMTAEGRYAFDISQLYDNHLKNLMDFTESIKEETDVVICDNINLSPWQTESYTRVCRKFGYQIVMVSFSPRNLQDHVRSQQVTPEKPDAHGVPEEVLIRFIEEWKIYTPLLKKSTPIDPTVHKHYFWNELTHEKEESKESCRHFDLDHLIEIQPDTYHFMKRSIGSLVYDYVMNRHPIS